MGSFSRNLRLPIMFVLVTHRKIVTKIKTVGTFFFRNELDGYIETILKRNNRETKESISHIVVTMSFFPPQMILFIALRVYFHVPRVIIYTTNCVQFFDLSLSLTV